MNFGKHPEPRSESSEDPLCTFWYENFPCSFKSTRVGVSEKKGYLGPYNKDPILLVLLFGVLY